MASRRSGAEPDLAPCLRPDLKPRAHNLPRPASRFVGREREIGEIKDLLCAPIQAEGRHGAQLVTLTGPGGCGKTRLASEIGCRTVEAFSDGVWWADLASLSDPALVPQAIASALGLSEQPGIALSETLSAALESSRALLVFDNCEQLSAACAVLSAQLMQNCPALRILATSQAPLNVAGETVWSIQPLDVPEPRLLFQGEADLPTRLRRYESVQLFVERAAAVAPGFELTNSNAVAVADICRRLDGMPLAIELAAARLRMLTVQQIAERLDDAFRLLTRGGNSVVPRHQTLRATVEWSYSLLTAKERVLLRRLTAFSGGLTLAAAEAICPGNGLAEDEMLDLLADLVDKSLILVAEPRLNEARYRLLEVIRQYGQEKLIEAGELDWARDNHLGFFLQLAEEAAPWLESADQAAWLDRLEADRDNLREALAWSLRGETPDPGPGARLAAALTELWYARGYLSEGRAWLEKAVARSLPVTDDSRARLISGAGTLAWAQGDYARATACHEESLSLYTSLGDQRGIAFSLNALGAQAAYLGRFDQAEALFDNALARYRELSDHRGAALVLMNLGHIYLNRNDTAAARAVYEESLALLRELEDKRYIAMALYNLGEVARARQEYRSAIALFQESILVCGEQGYKDNVAVCLIALGRIYCDQGDADRAASAHGEGLALSREIGDRRVGAEGLESLAWVSAARKRDRQAARLLGAAAGLREAIGAVLQHHDLARHEREMAAVCARLGDETFDAEWAIGKALPPDAVWTFAISQTAAAQPAPQEAAKSKYGGLTAREREVAALVAQGKSNRELADLLVVDVKTVEAHITRILSKLGFTSRAQVAAWAVGHGLAVPPTDLDTLSRAA